ncbi:hypothetical protein AB4158_17870 [Vibrio splendidus]
MNNRVRLLASIFEHKHDMAKSPKERQNDVKIRREQSGLIPKKCYFTKFTELGLEQISDLLGYNEKDLTRNENISFILDYCVSVTLSFLEDYDSETLPKTKEAQYLFKMKQIATFRQDQGDSTQDVLDFLIKWKYKTPTIIKKTKDGRYVARQRTSWSIEAVELLLNSKKYTRQVNLLNQHFSVE